MLNAHIERTRTAGNQAHPLPGGNSDLLFTQRNGSPLRHGLFYSRVFKPAVRRALPQKAALRFHDLRHTTAALLIEQGAHPKLISTRLGHSSITITLDRYGHLMPGSEAEAARLLDAYLTDRRKEGSEDENDPA